MTVIIVLLGLYLVFRVFGRTIMGFLIQKLMKRVAKDMQDGSRAYQRNYSGNPYEEKVSIDQEVDLSIPKNKPSAQISKEEIVEDIDFEESR